MPRYLLLSFLGIFANLVSSTVAIESIIGGLKAKEEQFRYQVSVQVFGQGHECGGGIIDDYYILTAAHCVVRDDGRFYRDPMFIVAGTDDLRKIGKPTVIAHVKTVFVPVEYQPPVSTSYGDIAVLKLKKSLRLAYNRNLMKLQLPTQINDDYHGTIAKIAGFGWNWVKVDGDHESGNNTDFRLRFAEADVFSTAQCQFFFQKIKIADKQLCAKVNRREALQLRGTCTGDSGGPLVLDDESIVIGVLSRGPIGCFEKDKPSIYTRVSHYLKFIYNSMHYKKKYKDIRINELIRPT